MTSLVSAAFDFESHYIEVLGNQLHYIEQGEGEVVLFLHGVPTWSYLWRNVLPYLSTDARCIAVDLIGFGRSDKPDIDYSVFDHIRYLEAFIKAKELKNITLVVHGWGSVPGLHYAMNHLSNIRAVAFLESYIQANEDWSLVSLPVQEIVKDLDEPVSCYRKLVEDNDYLNYILPQCAIRRLSDQEMEHYRAPFPTVESRKPIWQHLNELPTGGKREGDQQVLSLIANYAEKLVHSDTPKLMMYAVPGFVTTMDCVSYAKNNFKNLKLVCIGEALHYPQETDPDVIGLALHNWYRQLK